MTKGAFTKVKLYSENDKGFLKFRKDLKYDFLLLIYIPLENIADTISNLLLIEGMSYNLYGEFKKEYSGEGTFSDSSEKYQYVRIIVEKLDRLEIAE